MNKEQIKYIGVRISSDLHYKLHFIAKQEKRSGNGQILYLIRKCIHEFEKQDGEIIVPDEVKKKS